MSEPRITLLTKPGCHLCDEARVVIERVCASVNSPLANRAWSARIANDSPSAPWLAATFSMSSNRACWRATGMTGSTIRPGRRRKPEPCQHRPVLSATGTQGTLSSL